MDPLGKRLKKQKKLAASIKFCPQNLFLSYLSDKKMWEVQASAN